MGHVCLRCPHCSGHLNPTKDRFECYQDDGCTTSHWICNENLEASEGKTGCKRTFCIQVKQNDDGSPWIIQSALIELYEELKPIRGRPGSLYHHRTGEVIEVKPTDNSCLKAKSNYGDKQYE